MVTSVEHDHPRPTIVGMIVHDPVCLVMLSAIITACIVGGSYLIVVGVLMKLGWWWW